MKTIRITEEVHGKLAHLAYKESEMSFKSKKCTKCKKTRVGMYRIIYFIDESKKEIEIVDIGPWKNIYKKLDWSYFNYFY